MNLNTDNGFLANFDEWTWEIAAELAKDDGINELTDRQKSVIVFLREFYTQHKEVPHIRTLCREMSYSLEHLYELFPCGPSKSACRIAGLPAPARCS